MLLNLFDGFTHLCIELTVVSLLVTLILALTPPLQSVHINKVLASGKKSKILKVQCIPVVDLAVAIPIEGVLLPTTLRGGASGGGGHLNHPRMD